MKSDFSEVGSSELAKLWLPWTDETIYEGLTDEEAEEKREEIIERTGMEYVLRKDAPPDVVAAFEEAKRRELEEAELGIISD